MRTTKPCPRQGRSDPTCLHHAGRSIRPTCMHSAGRFIRPTCMHSAGRSPRPTCMSYAGRILLLGILLLLFFTPLSVSAEEETHADTMPPAYAEIPEALPPELRELLPDGLFSDSVDEALAAAETISDWSYLCSALLSAVGLRLSDAVGMLTAIVGLLLLSALLSRLRDGLSGGETLGFCLRLVLYTALVTTTAGMVQTVQAFFSAMDKISTALLPAMAALYTLGGNVGEAAVSGEVMAVFLAVCRYVSTAVTPPVCALCMAFALMDAWGTRLTLAPLAAQIKKWYTGLLSLVIFLLSLVLMTRSFLAGRADTWGMRGIKYAVGNWIPVVGGALGGTLGQVAAGVCLMRSVCGVSGVIVLSLTLLPPLLELLLFRSVLNLTVTVAGLLGCDGEGRLLGEMASLYGYMAAAVAISAVMLTLMLTLFLTGAVALA